MALGQLKAEQAIRHPKIDGRRWQLAYSYDTKQEAQARADSVRRHIVGGKARVRRIPDSAQKVLGTRLGKWGVYTP